MDGPGAGFVVVHSATHSCVAWSALALLGEYRAGSAPLRARDQARAVQWATDACGTAQHIGLPPWALRYALDCARKALAAQFFLHANKLPGPFPPPAPLGPPVAGPCPSCAAAPAVLVCDSVAVGQQASNHSLAPPTAAAVATAGTTYDNFALVHGRDSSEWHDVLLAYAWGRTGPGDRPAGDLGAPHAQYLLAPGAPANGQRAVPAANAAHALARFCAGLGSARAPAGARPLLRALASKSPSEFVGASGAVSAGAMRPAIAALASGVAVPVAALQAVQRHSEVLAEFVAAHPGAPPPATAGVFVEVLSLVDRYLAAVGAGGALPPQVPVNVATDWSQGHFYHECLRKTRSVRGGDARMRECRSDGVPVGCTKHKLDHPRFSPGVFVVCCEHGFVYGYSLMDRHESPRTPFDVFTNRVTDPQATTVVYDNGCNLLHYGLLRCTAFWSQVTTLIPPFHENGHVHCTAGLGCSRHPGRVMNPEGCEQFNAHLRHHETSLTYMTSHNAMHSMWRLVHAYNAQKASRR